MSGAFTFVELMVSIAIAVILILGVNEVFRIAARSVAAGTAMSEQSREDRALQTVFNNDLQQSIIRQPSSPAFIIRSTVASAFLDRDDMLSDRDYPAATNRAMTDVAVRTVDFNADNDESDPTDLIPRNRLGQRNFRQDVVGFFARHLYPRQTGNDGTYAANMTAGEAWIWYGHLRQPQDEQSTAATNMDPGWDNGTTTPMNPNPRPNPTVPTAVNNPNNFFARQWGLGRVATLMVQPNGAGEIDDKAGNPQRYFGRDPGNTDVKYVGYLVQDARSTLTNTGGSFDNTLLGHSRYDLAGISIDGYRAALANAIVGGNTTWFRKGEMMHRFAGYPYPTKPLDSYGVARTTPWLVGSCTGFIVEFAGDYLEQNEDPSAGPIGAITNNYTVQTDGKVDFTAGPDTYDNGSGPVPVRRVRWYGFPRDVSGMTVATVGRPDGVIDTTAGSLDVRPLRDSLPAAAPIEHFITGSSASTFPPANYGNPALGQEYIVAWQPGNTYPVGVVEPPKPTMLRITVILDDAAGRLPGPQTYEYVIQLP